MKKFVCMVLLCSLFFAGCTRLENRDDGKLNIVCTSFPQYDFARQITKGKANITLLVPPGAEAHCYEPTSKDIISLKNADLFIMNGGDSESWAVSLIRGDELKNTPVICLMDAVDVLSEEHVHGMETEGHDHGHSESHHKESYDEHIWTSPKNAVLMCNYICKELCLIDKANAPFYTKNNTEYTDKLNDLSDEFKFVAENSKRNTLVFGDRFPLRYLTEEYSVDYFAAFPGCSSKTEPSASTLIFLTEKVKNESIPAVIYMDYSDGRIAKTISDECGVRTLRMFSCHNLSGEDFKNGETYLSLMEKNLLSLKEALN